MAGKYLNKQTCFIILWKPGTTGFIFLKKNVIIAFMLAGTGLCLTTDAQRLNTHSYNIEDGLVNNDVLNIYQDSRGFIWLCTRGGLSRYDGSRFTNYTTDNGLINDMINDIVEITPQEFIIAQNSGGPCLLTNDRITSLTPGSKLTLNRFYTPDNNRLLATTDYNGLVEWDKGTFRSLNPSYRQSVSEITKVNDSLWLLHQQDAMVQLVTPSLGARSSVTTLNATTVYTDSHHQTWIGTHNGLKLLDPGSQPGKPIQFLNLPSSFDIAILREGYISSIMEDSRGNYWIGTISGLLKLGKNGSSRLYTNQDGLPGSYINCIIEDNQKNIWVGTREGLAKISMSDGMNVMTLSHGLAKDAGIVIWPAAKSKCWLFNRKNREMFDLHIGQKTEVSPANRRGYRIYKLNEKEMLIVDGKKGELYHAGKETMEKIIWPDTPFGTVMRWDAESFIAAGINKLSVISNGRTTEKLTINPRNWIQHLAGYKKNILWAGTWETGLLKINILKDHDSLQLKVIDTIAGLLADQHIRVLYSDRENELWIGTRYKGLLRLVELPDGNYAMQNYGTAEGLSSNFVLAINRDPAGNIWVGSMQGFDKLIPSGNRYRVFNFGRLNNFSSMVQGIHFLDSNYILVNGAPALLVARDINQDTISAPPVYIINASFAPTDTSSFLYANYTHLPFNKAQIYFEFSSPQYINEAFTKYSYRLLGGNDTTWTMSGRSHSVYFANLRPGHYTFEVRALGFNGQWGQAAVSSFLVDTPFWQTAWFITLIIAAIGLSVYALYRYRVKQLIRLQKVRNRIATDLHDEIGSNLTNISILTNLCKKNLSVPQKANDFLQRISEEVSSSSQALDDIIWSVNSNHDTMEETVARMRRYAAELFDAANIKYELYLDTAFEEKKLAMEQRRDIYLLYKEAVNNISKHAGAKHVNIKLSIEHHQLFLTISDDGKGFSTEKESGRHGLKGMMERVSKWGGKIKIESALQKGTTIEIRVPLAKE